MSLKKSELCALKDRIKGLAEEGRAHGRALSALRGPERAGRRTEKKGVGDTARAFLLAYALLRGVPYLTVERRHDPTRARRLVSDVADVVLAFAAGPGGAPPDTEVSDWMQGKEAAQ